MRKETGWNEANGMAHVLSKNVCLVKPQKSKGTRSCSSNWLKVKKQKEKRMELEYEARLQRKCIDELHLLNCSSSVVQGCITFSTMVMVMVMVMDRRSEDRVIPWIDLSVAKAPKTHKGR